MMTSALILLTFLVTGAISGVIAYKAHGQGRRTGLRAAEARLLRMVEEIEREQPEDLVDAVRNLSRANAVRHGIAAVSSLMWGAK